MEYILWHKSKFLKLQIGFFQLRRQCIENSPITLLGYRGFNLSNYGICKKFNKAPAPVHGVGCPVPSLFTKYTFRFRFDV